VLGVVMESGSKLPIEAATVKPLNRALAPMSSMADGRFILSDLDPGPVRFEVSAPGYVTSTCEVDIAQQGGDAALHCVLEREAVAGAISGQVADGEGNPVAGVKINVTGPYQGVLEPTAEGLFAAVDLPPGTYRLEAQAPGYYPQAVDVQLTANDTATPQITLVKKPEKELVEVKSTEIVIRQQVNFASGKAVIERSSEELMRQIRDVFIRFPNIKLVEIQGHTDSKGKHEYNMKLSQDRADAVRDWLLQAGIEPSRMVARGYGPDYPLTSNDTAANRAKNRRVQFIIKEQVK
jgi:outer membrane protein OmpA-like peptidoglycan-associated protein